MAKEHIKQIESFYLYEEADNKFITNYTPLNKMSDNEVYKILHEFEYRQRELKKLNEELSQAHVELTMRNKILIDTQSQLQDSAKKYSDLYDFAPVGFSTFNNNGIIVEANQTFATKLGIEREFLINKSFYEYISRDDHETFHSHISSIFETKTQQTCELKLIANEDMQFYAQLESIYMDDNNNQYGVCRTAISNITEHKLANDTLHEKEALYHKLFDHNPINTIVVNRDRKVIAFNKAKERSRDRLPHIGDVMYKDYAAHHEIDMHSELSKCINSGMIREFPEQEYDGKFLSIKISPYKDGAIITSEDVTEYKLAERKIEHLNEMLITIRNIDHLITHEKNHDKLLKGVCDNLIKIRGHSHAWVVLFDESGKITTTSQAGLSENFSSLSEKINENHIPYCAQSSLMQSDMIIIDDISSTCGDCSILSSTRCENSSIMLIRLECNEKIYGVLSIGTQSIFFAEEEEQALLKEVADELAFALSNIELLEERRNLQEQLIHSEKLSAVGQLAAGVAHEFNNMLAIILGYAQLSIEENSINEIKESLHEIENTTKRGGDLVKDLAAFARPKEPKLQTFDIIEIIDEVIRLQKKQLELDNIQVETKYKKHSKVSIDCGQMEQVFLNLFINAAHAIKPKGGGIISIKIKDEDNYLQIRLSDTGSGMDEETIKKIFLPFFTTKGGWAKNGMGICGTGLGLSVTHTIIEQHNGLIRVESKKNIGTTITISLPIAESELTKKQKTKAREKIFNVAIEKTKDMPILVIDDEEEIVNLMKIVFKKAGHRNVIIEKNGKNAVKTFTSLKPEIVFLDIIMPDTNGYQIFDEIKAVNPLVPIVFMSGKLGLEKNELMKKGAYDLIPKPFELGALFKILNRLAQEKKGQPE